MTSPSVQPPSANAHHPVLSSRLERVRQGIVDRAAARAHDALVARDLPRPGSSWAIVVVSVVVLVVAVAAFAALLWWTFQPKGLPSWVLVVLAWLVVVMALPRPRALDARPAPADAFPSLHRLVGDVAAGVGVRAPRILAVDTTFVMRVTKVGWRREHALLIGLPAWTMLPPDQRVALLAHELGHLRGRDTLRGSVVAAAHAVLESVTLLVHPLDPDSYGDFSDHHTLGEQGSQGFANRVGSGLLRVVSLPLVALLLGFERLAGTEQQRREYLADLGAARVAGRDAVLRLVVAMGSSAGPEALANSAVRRGDDPFAALDAAAQRPRLTASQLAAARARAREQDHAWDASHPRDDLRMSVLEACATTQDAADPVAGLPPRSTAGPAAATADLSDAVHGADRELATLRPELARQFRDSLIDPV